MVATGFECYATMMVAPIREIVQVNENGEIRLRCETLTPGQKVRVVVTPLEASGLADVVPAESTDQQIEAARKSDHYIGPILRGLDPETAKAIAEDPEFDLENSKPWP